MSVSEGGAGCPYLDIWERRASRSLAYASGYRERVKNVAEKARTGKSFNGWRRRELRRGGRADLEKLREKLFDGFEQRWG